MKIKGLELKREQIWDTPRFGRVMLLWAGITDGCSYVDILVEKTNRIEFVDLDVFDRATLVENTSN